MRRAHRASTAAGARRHVGELPGSPAVSLVRRCLFRARCLLNFLEFHRFRLFAEPPPRRKLRAPFSDCCCGWRFIRDAYIAFGQVFYYIAFQIPELVTGGDDGLARLLPTAARFRPVLDFEHLFQHRRLLTTSCSSASPSPIARWASSSPFGCRNKLIAYPRERTARPLWNIPVSHLDPRSLALLLLHGLCRSALRPAQQLRRSARPAPQPIGRISVMMAGGMRNFWGPLRPVRRAAGLSVEYYGQLDAPFVAVVLFFLCLGASAVQECCINVLEAFLQR